MADRGGISIPWRRIVLIGVILGVGLQLRSRLYRGQTPGDLLHGADKHEVLEEYSQPYLHKRVIRVTEDVYIALGYALGNAMLIKAPGGAIIVDTTEDLAAAREIRAAFRNITKADVKAILLTHHHNDHILGIKAFVEDNAEPPQIWAHESYKAQVQRDRETARAHFTRANRQFGPLLPEHILKGLKLRIGMDTTEIGPMAPTHYMQGQAQDLDIAGLRVQLLHLPGETDDHMGVWLPHLHLLLSGDNLYTAFPNLYPLRGAPPRQTLPWIRSLDKMRRLEPEYLVPSHHFPVLGKDKVHEVLGVYRDAIQLVHDQTVRYMNKGLHPDDIVPLVKLPAKLRNHPFLQEVYGTVQWSVKGVVSGYLGWFSGNAEDIESMTTKEKAQRMVQLAGGVGAMAGAAQRALNQQDYRWALQLSTHIFTLNPDHVHAKQIRLDSIKALAAAQTSSNGRNYLLTMALEDHNLVENKIPQVFKKFFLETMSLEHIFRKMALKLKAEEVEGVHMNVVFNFTDVGEMYNLELRHCLIDVQPGHVPAQYDVMVTMTTRVWRGIVGEEESVYMAYIQGELVVEGGILTFTRFMGYIEGEE